MKNIPKGIEVLVLKASVDPAFKDLLLARPLDAARSISLSLSGSEKAVLLSIGDEQLRRIIEKTMVPKSHMAAFLGKAAGAMLLALGVTVLGGCNGPVCTGIRPEDEKQMEKKEEIEKKKKDSAKDETAAEEEEKATDESKKDDPPPPPTTGIRPDRPEKK